MPSGIRKAGVRTLNFPEGRPYLSGTDAFFFFDFTSFAATFAVSNDTVSAVFPTFEISGFKIESNSITAPFPSFEVSLTAKSGALAQLSLEFPTFAPHFTALSGETLQLQAVFDVFETTLQMGRQWQIDALMPVFEAALTAALQPTITLGVEFPTLLFSGTIQHPALGSTDDAGATYEVWLVNSTTHAHSTYDNWNVNSHGYFNGSEIVLLNDGIYQVTGDADGSSDINAKIYWVASDLGTDRQKVIDSLSLNMRSLNQDEIRLVAIVDEQEKRIYQKDVSTRDEGLQRYRKNMPRGLQGQTWQFGFENVDGGNFVIDDGEVLVADKQRRFK